MQLRSTRTTTLDWPSPVGRSLTQWLEGVRGRLEVSPNALVAVLSLILSVPLAIRVYGGTLVRYAGDDWCWPTYLTNHAVGMPQQSFWSMQAFAYNHYFGRWASTALLTGVGQLGPMSAPVLASGVILLWLGSLTWCVYELTHRPAISFLFAQAVLVATFLAAPGLGIEATYWQAGLLTYMPPIILAGLGIATAVRFRSVPLAAAIAFVAAGFNEPATCVECAALMLLVIVCPREYRLLTATALLAAVISGAIMMLAPGNAERAAGMQTASLMSLPSLTLRATFDLTVDVLKSPAALAPLIMGIVFSSQIRAPGWASPIVIVGVVFGLAGAAMAPQVFGSQFAIFRAAFLPVFIVVLGLFGLGLHIGASVTAIPQNTALFGVFAIVAVLASSQAYGLLGPLGRYKDAVGFQDQALRQAAATRPEEILSIPRTASPFTQVWQATGEQDWLINRCIASYYGVHAVRAKNVPAGALRN